MILKYILQYNSLIPNGYNIREGRNNSKMNEETKLKISNKLKENWNNKTIEEKNKQKEIFMKAIEP